MKEEKIQPDDAKFGALLREGRGSPALPPHFQQNVWRRIEDAESPAKADSWLDALAALILRPRLAFAAMAMLVLTGALLGTHQGVQNLRHAAQARYAASVAPDSLR